MNFADYSYVPCMVKCIIVLLSLTGQLDEPHSAGEEHALCLLKQQSYNHRSPLPFILLRAVWRTHATWRIRCVIRGRLTACHFDSKILNLQTLVRNENRFLRLLPRRRLW